MRPTRIRDKTMNTTNILRLIFIIIGIVVVGGLTKGVIEDSNKKHNSSIITYKYSQPSVNKICDETTQHVTPEYYSKKRSLDKEQRKASIFLIIIVIIVLTIYILFSIVASNMATKRGRNAFAWFLLALFISPFLSYLILFLLGETEEAQRQRIIRDELWRKEAGLK